MEFIEPIIAIVKFIGVPISEWWKYHKGLDKSMKILKSNLSDLNGRKKDIESQLKAELHPRNKLPKQEVTNWLENVPKFNTEAQKIEKQVEEKRYLSRARLGKLVDEKIQEVKQFYENGVFSNGLVVDAPPSIGVTFPTITIVGETTSNNMKEIWEDLMNDKVGKIGVWGLGGVGKTTIMKDINNRLLKETNKFDHVIWVTVSRELNVIKLQNAIAHALNQDLSKCEDKTIRIGMLLEMLENVRYVLILDDMWESLSLEEVGIPEPTKINGVKLVLTTRINGVCRSMGCKIIKVELLTEKEAWKLFSDNVGHDVFNIPTLASIGKKVVEQCACLPLAIVTIASQMKGEHGIYEWNIALNELRSGHIKGAKGMASKVFESLKISYEGLDSNVQPCFLYCAFFPKDFQIKKEELIEYWITEELMEGMASRETQYFMGHSILNTLKNNCLLESSEYERVKMHGLVWRMALNITMASSRFMVKAGINLDELPNEPEWTQDLEKVSLMMNCISEIPSNMSPKCQRLSTFILRYNPVQRISDSFFVHMLKLKVLDLSYTAIGNLPDSSSNLENLTALLLRSCSNLKYVPSLAKLKELRKLDLENTGIEEVPQGMEMLVKLGYLNLNTNYLKTLPTGILPKLSHLRCLIVWWGSKTLKVKAEEVAGLKGLDTFAGQLYDLHDFNIYVKSSQGGRRPHKYLLAIGPGKHVTKFDEEWSLSSNKRVVLTKCSISRGGEEPLALPNDVEHLIIKKCHDVSSLSDVSSLNKATDFLKSCYITNCDGLKYVLSSSSSSPLQSLEVLNLDKLQNLCVLLKGGASPPSPGTFSCLKEFHISSCPNIYKLFTPGLLMHLQNLELIDVCYCNKMEEMISAKAQGEETDTITRITLPKLRILSLWHLPELKSIVYNRGMMVCDSLQKIILLECPKLKRLPLSLPLLNGQPSSPPALRLIEVSDAEWWELLEWEDQPYAKNVLQPFVR